MTRTTCSFQAIPNIRRRNYRSDLSVTCSELSEQSECSEEDDHIQSEKTSKKIFKVALENFNNQQYKKTIKFLEPLILDTSIIIILY